MRHLLLAALGVFAVSGAASAQQPPYLHPARSPVPAAASGAALQPASGTTVIGGGAGCTNCGTTAGVAGRGFTMAGAAGGNCQLGAPCQSGCGSLKSDLAFQFGSCKNFFAPCGPTCGGLFGSRCPTGPMNQPWGTGFGCPRAYDSHANH